MAIILFNPHINPVSQYYHHYSHFIDKGGDGDLEKETWPRSDGQEVEKLECKIL